MIEKVKGCLLAGALGDAYGYRFVQADLPAKEDQWRFTDAFQYTVATCLSVLEHEKADAIHIAKKMRSWYMDQQLSGLGQETLNTLSELVGGEHWSSVGSEGDVDGNTAVLRSAPLAFILDPGKAAELQLLREIISISHPHPEAFAGALALVLSIRYIQNDRLNFIQHVIKHLPASGVREGLEAISKVPGDRIRDVGRSFGCGKKAIESVPFAIFAAQQAPQLGMQTMMNEIVAAGGDTHGNCSMAGAIAGAFLGVEGIPEHWMDKLRQIPVFAEGQQAFKDFAAFVERNSGIQTLF